jgi:hypothetical protein
MIMSGICPHMINETWDGFSCWLGVGQSCGLG